MAFASSYRLQNDIQDGVKMAGKEEATKDVAKATRDLESDTRTLPSSRLPLFTANYDAPFKVKTSALIYLRVMNLARETGVSDIAFQLAANVGGAGRLGDVVLKLSCSGKFSAIFLQLKPAAKLVVSPKTLTDTDNCFPLQTYFESYLEIKESMAAAEKGSLFDLEVEDCVFATYTNARGSQKLGSVHGKTYTVLSLESVMHSFGKGARYHRFCLARDETLGECLRGEPAEGAAFLSRFRIFTRQPELGELDQLIRDELTKMDNAKFSGLDVGRLGACFLEKVEEWWAMDDVVLDKNSDLLERARLAMNRV